jgi:hypothetical protein
MVARRIGTDRRAPTNLVALVVVTAIPIALLAAQTTSLLPATTETAHRPPAIVSNELPTGPQHSQGPHPYRPRSQDIAHGAKGKWLVPGDPPPPSTSATDGSHRTHEAGGLFGNEVFTEAAP